MRIMQFDNKENIIDWLTSLVNFIEDDKHTMDEELNEYADMIHDLWVQQYELDKFLKIFVHENYILKDNLTSIIKMIENNEEITECLIKFIKENVLVRNDETN